MSNTSKDYSIDPKYVQNMLQFLKTKLKWFCYREQKIATKQNKIKQHCMIALKSVTMYYHTCMNRSMFEQISKIIIMKHSQVIQVQHVMIGFTLQPKSECCVGGY